MERLFSQPFGDSLHSLLAVFVLTEGGKTDVAFARRTEAYTWGADYACAIEHFLEELPAWCIVRSLHPEIWSILATIYSQSEFLKFRSHKVGILHIVIDGCLYLFLPLWGVDGFGSTLADIAGSIKLGALTAVPDRIQCHFLTVQSLGFQFLWYDGVSTAYTGETGSLGITVEFDGHLSGSTNLLDRMRDFRVGDVCLVGSII